MTLWRGRLSAIGEVAAAGIACVLSLSLSGCGSVGAITGAVAGVSAGSASTNPAVGIGSASSTTRSHRAGK